MNPQDAPIIEAGIYFVTEPDFAIMLLRRLVVSLVLLFATSRAATPARSITDLFQVSVDSTVGGNCAQYGTDKLQQLLNDALTLCNEAIDGMNDYINSNRGSATLLEARRLINAYFRTPPVADRPNLLCKFSRRNEPRRKRLSVKYSKLSESSELDYWWWSRQQRTKS